LTVQSETKSDSSPRTPTSSTGGRTPRRERTGSRRTIDTMRASTKGGVMQAKTRTTRTRPTRPTSRSVLSPFLGLLSNLAHPSVCLSLFGSSTAIWRPPSTVAVPARLQGGSEDEAVGSNDREVSWLPFLCLLLRELTLCLSCDRLLQTWPAPCLVLLHRLSSSAFTLLSPHRCI
jgi:hypothetical protein